MRRLSLTLALLFTAGWNPTMAETVLSYDQIFGKEGRGVSPTRVRWTSNGDLTFLLKGDDGTDLWVLRNGGDSAELLLAASKALESGEEVSLEDYQWSPDGRSVLLLSQGNLFLRQDGHGKVRRLTSSDDEIEDPKFSPDGKKIAFVRNANLWLLDLKSRQETALTEEGVVDEILLGKTDWVYWEELWGRNSTGFWWSPDSTKIALYRFDDREVKSYPLLNAIPLDAEVKLQPYPRAGETNPDVRVGVLHLESREIVWMKTEHKEEVYLPRVTWTPRGDLAIHRLNRQQNRLDLLRCDAEKGRCTTWLSEKSSSWIDIEDDFHLLESGGLIWGSDREGWRRLYLHDEQGKRLRALTSPDLAVTSLNRVVEKEERLIYTAFRTSELGAKERQVYDLDWAAGENRLLSRKDGWSTTVVSQQGDHRTETWSSANDSRTSVVINHEGQSVELPQVDPTIARDSLPQWRFLTIPGPNGSQLPARLLSPARPAEPESRTVGGRYPVIMYHYGGPASQVVLDNTSSRPTRDLWHLRQAQRGYGVLQVDNEASLFFGKKGAKRLYGHFGELELEGQLAAVEYLKTLDWVDGDRIVLWGWSGGGANTLYSILHAPGTWAAATAGAPVTNWLLYDSIWTERYLGHPDDNPDGYRDSSAINAAGNLRDPLLLVHGTADDNVHPSNTLAISQKLIAAGLPFEQAFYPRQKHRFGDASSRHFYERMEEFFDRHTRPE